MLPTNRAPTSPGEVLNEDFLKPLHITQAKLAKAIGVSVQTVNLLVNGKRAVTVDMAVALGAAFNVTPQFWMNLQVNLDLWRAQRKLKKSTRLASFASAVGALGTHS